MTHPPLVGVATAREAIGRPAMGAHHDAVACCSLQCPLAGVVVLLSPWKWVVLFARAPWGLAPSRGRESSRPRVLSLSECRGYGSHDQSTRQFVTKVTNVWVLRIRPLI